MSSALERIARNAAIKKGKNKEVQTSKGVDEDLPVILAPGGLRPAQALSKIPKCRCLPYLAVSETGQIMKSST